jgi:signal transduction histidine kinase/DNA-binding response OmpR family regulator/ligand-binding sensor domain-containing protein
MRIKLTILIFILSAFNAYASQLKFYSINSLYGISVRATNSIVRDDNGFIWASSKTGILRLTDDDYRIYQLPYQTAGAITVKLACGDSKLIAYSNNGQIFSYNPLLDRFELVVNLSKLIENPHFDVYGLLAGESGIYWIATNAGIYRYQSGDLRFLGEVSSTRYSVSWYDHHQILFSGGEEIGLLNIETEERQTIYKIPGNLPMSVSSEFYDKNERKLWLGTMSSGLFSYDFRSGNFAHVLDPVIPKQPVLALAENSDSTIMAGIDGQGIWVLDKKGSHLLNVFKENDEDPGSLRGNGVYDILYEPGKRVWVSTISGGISFYDLSLPIVTQIVHQAHQSNSLANNEINCILEDRDGKWWFATNNGISCWNAGTGEWKNFYNNKLEQAQVFLSLCEDDQGRIWAGSYSSGFYVLDQRSGKELAHHFRNEKTLPSVSNFIFDIYKDSDGDIWIGGVNGRFVRYQMDNESFITYTDEPVSSFCELEPGKILVGLSYGLALIDKQTGALTTLLSGIVVQDILVIKNKVWICTSGEGLIEYTYDTGALVKYDVQSGLPSDFINSVIFSDNYLWLGTENGLCRFDPADNSVISYQSIFALSGVSYNKSAVSRSKNGQLAWGTNHGAVFFHPDALTESKSDGRIFFQDIMISGRSIREIPDLNLQTPVDELRLLNLRYFQNTIHLELVPIGIPSGARFSWKLEGFDTEWNPPSDSRIVTYTNLPAGRFELKIRLLDSSMKGVVSERSITIRLIPPFWKKTWFWGSLLVLLSGIVFLYLLLYIKNLKQKHNEEKIRFFTNTAHDIRTALTLIKAPIEELNKETSLSASGNYFLGLAKEQTRQLSSVVTQLMDFQKADIGKEYLSWSAVDIVKLVKGRIAFFKPVASNRKIRFVVSSNRERYLTCADEAKLEKAIDNLISNAVKYSKPDGQVHIVLNCDDTHWVLQVKDQGIGISRKAQTQLFKEFYRGENAVNSKIVGSGIGLLLVRKYVAMHGGEVFCDSQENAGSTFKLEVPYKSITECEQNEGLSGLTADIPVQESGPISGKPRKEPVLKGGMRILIVEDNEDLLNFMETALEDEFSVMVARNGDIAWELTLKHLPDLVVSDIMMPGMDGFEFCRLVKSTYETSHIPVILLSALSEKSEQLHGLGLGADDYLTKPFDMSLLTQRIRSIIRNREIVQEKALKLISNSGEEPLLINELNDTFLKRMVEVAKANIPNAEFDKDDFALAMNVSSSLLYKKMKALTNMSPTEFVKTMRMKHAMELLQSRRYSVTEVSELCGFTSVGYFSTVFKKYYQKSPTEV